MHRKTSTKSKKASYVKHMRVFDDLGGISKLPILDYFKFSYVKIKLWNLLPE